MARITSSVLSLLILTPIASHSPARAADSSAVPETQQTAYLFESCQRDESSRLRSYCLGYLSGVFDLATGLGTVMAQSSGNDGRHAKERNLAACQPNEAVSLAAVRQVFLSWVEKHPAQLHQSSLTGVISALREKWPCAPNAAPQNSPDK
ncbi:MAG: Rap1a/Tai family immunity protein [Stellaceae bacterium]